MRRIARAGHAMLHCPLRVGGTIQVCERRLNAPIMTAKTRISVITCAKKQKKGIGNELQNNTLPIPTSSGGRTRTSDLRVMSPTSCQLLHPAMYNLKRSYLSALVVQR